MYIKSEIHILDKKTSAAEEGYRCIEKAWHSTKDVTSRIDSLLVLARELRMAEEHRKNPEQTSARDFENINLSQEF